MKRALVTAPLALCGCIGFSPPDDPTASYYVLAPSSSTDRTGAHLHLRTVEVPSYLRDDERIAVRSGPHRVTFSELHAWAEPLEDGIARVLGEELRARARASTPAADRVPHDEVTVSIDAFEARVVAAGWTADVAARWSVHRSDRNAPPISGRFRASPRTFPAGDRAMLVAELSAALAELATAIVSSVSATD